MVSALAQVNSSSSWDKGLLDVKISNVNIEKTNLPTAWEAICQGHLVRTILFYDRRCASGGTFTFRQNNASVRELLEALVTTYPGYTYTQDSETGVTWLHPKSIKYEDILADTIDVNHNLTQVRLITDVIQPICRLLSPRVLSQFEDDNSAVDISSGTHSFRQILNQCCLCNPTLSFAIHIVPEGKFLAAGSIVVRTAHPLSFAYPTTTPREPALAFWDAELGTSTNAIPTLEDIRSAMADADAHKRWAAKMFLTAARRSYDTKELIKGSSADESARAILGVEGLAIQPLDWLLLGRLTNTLFGIHDPSLALLLALETAHAGRTNPFLDSIVANHFFTESEVANLKPDLYRFALRSNPIMAKLKDLHLDTLGFPTNLLTEIVHSNRFTLVTAMPPSRLLAEALVARQAFLLAPPEPITNVSIPTTPEAKKAWADAVEAAMARADSDASKGRIDRGVDRVRP
jgi:hypothetical protein